MRDSYSKFEAHGIKLYAISYDDEKTLREFADAQSIPYPLLSDIDSEVIENYGILNTEVSKDDAFLHGIPFPGAYVTDANGVVVAKFFHDTYKKRDSAETFIDAAVGNIHQHADAPSAEGGQPELKITAFVHGGSGSIRQGIIRKLVVRFDLADGLHIYSRPVPDGMVATELKVSGPVGFIAQEIVWPKPQLLDTEFTDKDLYVWSGTTDIVIPFYADGDLVSETRPLDVEEINIELSIRYQACTSTECLLPRTETLHLTLNTDVIDVPKLKMHLGHGQRESQYDSTPALRRLIWRKAKQNPLGLPKFVWKSIKLEWAARRRGA